MEDWLGAIEPEVIEVLKTNKSERRERVENAFSGLEDAMNIDPGSTKLPKGMAKAVKRNTELAVQEAKEVLADPSEEAFEDKEFIRLTIKTQIVKMQGVLEIMEGNISMGAEPRMYEVYSALNKSVLDACNELLKLQKQAENAKLMKAPPAAEASPELTLTKTTTQTIKAKGGGMAELLEQIG